MTVLLWYWRHHNFMVSREADVEDAIGMARYYQEYGEASVDSIEVDGEVIDWMAHPYYLQLEAAEDKKWEEQKKQPLPTHRIDLWNLTGKQAAALRFGFMPEIEADYDEAVAEFGADRVRLVKLR